MAIVSISRLQQRRGLFADLPASLNEAEFGWCLDTRQLFIGNGNTYTGNSQILTQWSPNDQIITHTYQGYTGISAQGTVPRELGSILDDSLNVKDYGAVGDGIADDTAAIQQAIADQWARIAANPVSNLSSRNVINFPAGTYLVTQTIDIYPYIILSGEGRGHTSIKLAAGATAPIFRTADSLGQTGTNIGLNGAVLPTGITWRYMNIDASLSTVNQAVLLQRCSYINFQYVSIIGSWSSPNDPAFNSGGILIESLGNAFATSDITVIDSTFSNCSYALSTSDAIQRIAMQTSQIRNCYVGLQLLGTTSGPSYVNVTQNLFNNIDSYGIQVDTYNRGVTSVGNSFKNVGTVAVVPAIYWTPGSQACSSVGDVFDQNNRTYRIYNGQPNVNMVLDAQQTEIVQNVPTPMSVTLLPNQTSVSTGITYSLSGISTFTLQIPYTVTMDTYRRGGTLYVVSDGATAELVDQSVSLNNAVSITFGVTVVSGTLEILYTSTGSASGILKYITTEWKF